MRKSTRKVKTIRKKTINNRIEKDGGGFDYLELAPRERSSTKVG